jgi:N-acetyl sugar amidotransferase
MDTTDPKIYFDEHGVCDHCHGFYRDTLPHWHPNIYGRVMLEKKVAEIKRVGKGKKYDCIMGMSGGLDSSYLLHLVVTKFNLRPLVFHVDGGWNTELAVSNIENLVKKLDLELFVEVINWKEMRDFQLALFKSGTPHLDLAQDHAFFATMYHFANKHGIKYILNGGNFSTECIRNPKDWLYYGTDMAFINDVRKKFGTIKMETYPWSGILYHKVYLRYIKGIEVIKPLNLLQYKKESAIRELSEMYDWQAYPQKHFESYFTRFYEGYWLPKRFNMDTRKVQYSSLIVTNQITRDQALELLEKPPYPDSISNEDFTYVAKKLGITEDELTALFNLEKKSFKDYKNQEYLFDFGAKVLQKLGIERAVKR